MSINRKKKSTESGKNVAAQSGHNISVINISVEFVSILLSVLLALGLNEWRENRSHQKQAQAAIKNIENELKSNMAALTNIHENNKKTMQSLNNEQKSDAADSSKFVPGLQLRDTAWQTFLSTGISNFVDYEKVLMLSQTYSYQEIYKQTGLMITEAAMHTAAVAAANGRNEDVVEFEKHFKDYLQMLVDLEEAILESYKSTLEKLENIEAADV